MPPCPTTPCCNCTICAQVIDYTTQAVMPDGTVTITYRDSAGTSVGTETKSYTSADTPPQVCFTPDASLVWQSYELSGTSPDTPYPIAVTVSRSGNCPVTTLPGCGCAQVPTTLVMSVSNPALNYGIFHDATLVYGPTPAAYLPLSIGTSSFLSTESFTDQVTGDVFRYWFTCYSGYYVLGRVYEHYLGPGLPFRDMFRYTWLIGVTGNACDPFFLGHGTVWTGGDPSEVVTVGGTRLP